MSDSLNNLDPDSRMAMLAALPPGHPEREGLVAEIALLDPAKQEAWRGLLRETDLLHAALRDVPVPSTLEQKLLALPDTTDITVSSTYVPVPSGLEKKLLALPDAAENSPTTPSTRLFPRKRVLLYAACLLILIPVAIIAWLNFSPAEPSYGRSILPTQVASDLADIAIHVHEAPPPLAITSADPDVVAAALKSNDMPFPTMVLKPVQPLTLLGGGLCNFGTTRAIFTRWQSASATYTLYQFDGSPLHVPPSFQSMIVPAPTLSHGPYTYRVALWPATGNACTWALVMEKPDSPNPFGYTY